MARKGRIFVEETMQYITLVCDESSGMFTENGDYHFFLSLLEELVQEYALNIHAYTLLPHSFEALATPRDSEALSKFMQLLARRYVLYFNKKHTHGGTLWKRRYVSVLVDDEYLYETIKYIETKSLNIVENEKRYRFSSIRANLGAEENGIIQCHKSFSSKKYKQNYSSFLTLRQWDFIDKSIEKQHIIGSSRFIQSIEEKTGMSLRTQARGRPRKNNSNKRISMYKNLVVLDKEKHKIFKISPLSNLLFAKDMTVLPLAHLEIASIGKYYPVVFSQHETPSFITLVSLGQTNLAITPEGQWIGEYIPAVLRKYPFSILQSNNDESKSIVMIDEDASILSKTKGKQLFKKSGESAEVLEKSINFVSHYEKEMQKTQRLASEIKASGVLEEKEILVKNDDEESKALIHGFSIVNEEKLAKLDPKLLEKWEKNGAMAIIKAHLASLQNVKNLFNLAKNRQV